MWRSSVLGLRSCSSAVRARCHHDQTPKLRRYSSRAAEPVSEEEFLSALEKLVPRHRWKLQQTFGFAVSGGVDSMALATLYANASRANSLLPKGHAFIVDHNVRPESTEEAKWVAQQLRSNTGIEATILPLTWPNDNNPFDYKNFETAARVLRYRALGFACRSSGIDNLLLAHHADDQAETVMMRLQSLRWRTGLRGIQSAEWVPECYGIHGVYHSTEDHAADEQKEADGGLPYPVEFGGIRILRPLLSFEKGRLIRTCEEHGVSWAEDKTNSIPTLTTRNAVRHIIKHHELPAALDINALVKVSEQMQKRIDPHKNYAEKLFNDLPLKLDIQTGSLVARLPPYASLLERPIVTELDRIEARNNTYYLLERLAELVTPRAKPAVGQLSNAIDVTYPALDLDNDVSENPKVEVGNKSFCAFGVWWRPWDQPTPFYESNSNESLRKHERDWLLCRQPLEESERHKPQTRIVFPPSPSTVPLTGTPLVAQSPEQWYLFDGRFWIQVHNHTNSELILRTLEDPDLLELSSSQKTHKRDKSRQIIVEPQPHRFIQAALSLIRPYTLRRHLPAIFLKENMKEKLIALPTLNVSLFRPGPNPSLCTWEVRYKKISPGSRQLQEIVLPGIRPHHIMAHEKQGRNENQITKNMNMPYNAGINKDRTVAHWYSGYKTAKEANRISKERKR